MIKFVKIYLAHACLKVHPSCNLAKWQSVSKFSTIKELDKMAKAVDWSEHRHQGHSFILRLCCHKKNQPDPSTPRRQIHRLPRPALK